MRETDRFNLELGEWRRAAAVQESVTIVDMNGLSLPFFAVPKGFDLASDVKSGMKTMGGQTHDWSEGRL